MSAELPGDWSASWSAPAGTLAIDMSAMPASRSFVAERLRVGPVLFDVEVRRRHATLLIRLLHRQGPVATLSLRLPSPGPGLVEVDGVALGGGEVRFPFSARHEVVAYY